MTEESKTAPETVDEPQYDASLEPVIEALLLVSAEPLSFRTLAEILDDVGRDELREAMSRLVDRYRGAAGGLVVQEVAGGFRLATRPEYAEWVQRLSETQHSQRLSNAALQVLAIVAYHQPITGPEIQEVRGSNPSGVLKTLMDHHLVKVVGRKKVVGKPFLYGTTREFLLRFGLGSLRDLPAPDEFAELAEEVVEEGEAPTADDAPELYEDEPDEIPDEEPPPAYEDGEDDDADERDDGDLDDEEDDLDDEDDLDEEGPVDDDLDDDDLDEEGPVDDDLDDDDLDDEGEPGEGRGERT